MNLITFLVSLTSGYQINRILSKDGGRLNRHLPIIKLKFLQFSPHIKIHFKNHTFHLHHWLTYTLVLVITFTYNMGILESIISRGYLIGGIIQGLSFLDWNNFVASKVTTKHNNAFMPSIC